MFVCLLQVLTSFNNLFHNPAEYKCMYMYMEVPPWKCLLALGTCVHSTLQLFPASVRSVPAGPMINL